MRRWLFLLLPLLLLAGCGRSQPRTELELWITDALPDTRDLLDKQLIPRFEAAHPGVKVNVQYISWANIDQKLTISFAGGVEPDVYQVGAEYVGGLAYRGMAEPLDDRIAKWGKKDDFFPASWNTCVYQGKTYGLPYLSAPRVLMYRKDLLAQAGFAHPPDTWEELAAAAEKMTRRNGKIIDFAGHEPGGELADLRRVPVGERRADLQRRRDALAARFPGGRRGPAVLRGPLQQISGLPHRAHAHRRRLDPGLRLATARGWNS